MARPSKYNPDFHVALAAYYARQGMIEEEIAKKLDITRSTLSKWKKEHSEFSDALKESKEGVDSKVENSLLRRALGYEYEETEITAYKDGKPSRVKRVKKQAQPDTTAIIFWLKNRQKDRWRDTQYLAGDKDAPLVIKPVWPWENDDEEPLEEA